MYRRISDPALHTQERLFFELYARALVDGAEVEGFLPEAVEAWIEPSSELFRRLGFDEHDARAGRPAPPAGRRAGARARPARDRGTPSSAVDAAVER